MLIFSGFLVEVESSIDGPVRTDLIIPSGAAPKAPCLVSAGELRVEARVHRDGAFSVVQVLFPHGVPAGRHHIQLVPSLRNSLTPSHQSAAIASRVHFDRGRIAFQVDQRHYTVEGVELIAAPVCRVLGDHRRWYLRAGRVEGGLTELWIDEFGLSGEIRGILVCGGPARGGASVRVRVSSDEADEMTGNELNQGWTPPFEEPSASQLLAQIQKGPRVWRDSRWAFACALGVVEAPRRVMSDDRGVLITLVDEQESLTWRSPRRLRVEIRAGEGSVLPLVLIPIWKPRGSKDRSCPSVFIDEVAQRTAKQDAEWVKSESGGHGVAERHRGDFRLSHGTWSHHEWDVPLGLACDAMSRLDVALWRRATISAQHQVGSTIHPAQGLNLKHGAGEGLGESEVGHHVIVGASMLARLIDDPWMQARLDESQRRSLPHLDRVVIAGSRGQDVAWALAALAEAAATDIPKSDQALKKLLALTVGSQSAAGHLLIESARRTGWFRIPPWHDAGLLFPTLAMAGAVARDPNAATVARRAAIALVAALKEVEDLPSSLIVDARGQTMSLGGETAPEEAGLAVLGVASLGIVLPEGWKLQALRTPQPTHFQGGGIARLRLGLAWSMPRRLRTCSGRRKGGRARPRFPEAFGPRCPSAA